MVAHGAILRIRAKDPLLADQVAINHRKADITPRQRAMLDFAVKVTNDSKSIADEDFAALREHGFSDEDIWDIAGITAFFGLSNRMANFTVDATERGVLHDGKGGALSAAPAIDRAAGGTEALVAEMTTPTLDEFVRLLIRVAARSR